MLLLSSGLGKAILGAAPEPSCRCPHPGSTSVWSFGKLGSEVRTEHNKDPAGDWRKGAVSLGVRKGEHRAAFSPWVLWPGRWGNGRSHRSQCSPSRHNLNCSSSPSSLQGQRVEEEVKGERETHQPHQGWPLEPVTPSAKGDPLECARNGGCSHTCGEGGVDGPQE